MKHLLIVLVIGLSMNLLKAQDTLYLKNGEFIVGKVLEVNPTEVKYKKAQIMDGPIYVSYKSDIALIQYKNGFKEVFTPSMSQMPGVSQPVNIQPAAEPKKEAKTHMEPVLKYYPYGNHKVNGYEKPQKNE